MTKLGRATGRPQLRRATPSAAGLVPSAFVTVSFSLPHTLAELLKSAALKRDDLNKSAIVSEALAEYFGVTVEAGGGNTEKAEIRA